MIACLMVAALMAAVNPKPITVPEVTSWEGGEGVFKIASADRYFSCDYLGGFSKSFERLTGRKITLTKGRAEIVFSLEEKKKDSLGEEGYVIKITPKRVSAVAATRTGMFYASRTLLQLLKQNPKELPCGRILDVPSYRVRGMVFDVGRLPVPIEFLYKVVDIMSDYKMNDLQLHLNDNYIWHEDFVKQGKDPFKESYAAFRLESKLKGLTAKDVFYTKKDFAKLVAYAKGRGVRIVPEIDSPGHALALTRVRPDLIYQGPMRHHAERRCEMIDAANPKALEFVCSIFDEYLEPLSLLEAAPFAKCPVLHVGSDEFFGGNEDYRKFLDGLLGHVESVGHTPRAWCSLKAKPGSTPVRAKGVQMNIWSRDWGLAQASIDAGYDIINTFDKDLYFVPTAGYYRMDRNLKHLWENWVPNRIGADTIDPKNPHFLGASWAVWNDMIGPRSNGYTYKDLEAPIRAVSGILAEKMWGTVTPSRSYDEQVKLLQVLR